jgi:hypothetical protein
MDCHHYRIKSHLMSECRKKKSSILQTEKGKEATIKIDFKRKKKKDKTTIMRVEED